MSLEPSLAWKYLTPLAFPHRAGSWIIFMVILWTLACLFWSVETRYLMCVLIIAEKSGIITFLSLLVMTLQLQPSIRFAFVATVMHCWLLFIVFARTARYFSAKLLPSNTDPGLCRALWLPLPRCRTVHSSLLNFTLILLAPSYSLSRSLRKMTHPSSDVSTSPSTTWLSVICSLVDCLQSHHLHNSWWY